MLCCSKELHSSLCTFSSWISGVKYRIFFIYVSYKIWIVLLLNVVLDLLELDSRASNLAAELQMAIGITFLESNDPKPLNSVTFFDRHGNEILHYAKVHMRKGM